MYRKAYQNLLQWKNEEKGSCAIMIDGARRVGKSYLAQEFAKNEYESYILIDFFTAPDEVKELFEKYLSDLDTLFMRLSALPRWSWQNWYLDFSKSGSVICDMQIHDLDMARYLFGEPAYIECRASTKNVKYDLSHISLGYGFPCTCIGDWTLVGTRFTHKYTVGFERATVIMDGGTVTVYPNDGSAPFEPEFAREK